MQEVYIYMDDSGKLSNLENCCTYGGIIFLSKSEKDKFITQYRSIINDIKCKYCSKIELCDNKCLEIKNCMTIYDNGRKKYIYLESDDKRRIKNYIKSYMTFCCAIENSEIKKTIINDKASKGRYLDYVQKIMIKEIVVGLIKKKIIDPKSPLKLIITIDEQATKSNGYYNLYHSIREEFLHGIVNYNYGIFHNPILFNELNLNINYVKSDLNFPVQASDFVAGETREIFKQYLENKTINVYEKLNFVDYRKFFP